MSAVARRLLLVNAFDAHAGSQRVGQSIVTSLWRAGFDVAVKLGFGGRGFLSELPGIVPDVHCNHVPTRKLLYPFWVFTALTPIAWAAGRGRIIWANSVYAIAPALLAILLFPHRTVVHLHEASFPLAIRLLLRLAVWRGSAIVCVSVDQARRIDIDAHILPNAVVLPTVDPPSGGNRLLFVGTTHPIKGFQLFVSVCERLRHVPLQAVAYLSDAAVHEQELVARARTAGISVFFGERSPAAMYRDGFLLLMSSDARLVSETFSLVAAEAVAWLVPVGGAGAAVLPEVLGDALAFNEPSRDPDRIANAIADLQGDPERQVALRHACEARRPHFSETEFVDRIVGLLQNLQAR